MPQEVPHFIIAGTQKAGTTWLEHRLLSHPDIYTPRRQLHFFDRHFENGTEWYRSWFQSASRGQLCGEKTTEYFDVPTAEPFARRVAEFYPETKVIVILRDPAKRAMSALTHTVNSGLEKMPRDPDDLLFRDMERPPEKSFRYIERGFYAGQLKALYRHIAAEKILMLIFEEDIVDAPDACLRRVHEFLGVRHLEAARLDEPVNKLRLSAGAVFFNYWLYNIPYSRSVVRRIDKLLGLPPWRARFRETTRKRLYSLYQKPNEELFALLERPIPSWVETMEAIS